MYASGGKVGGWTINPTSLSARNLTLFANGSINSNDRFMVDTEGNLTANNATLNNAYVSGTVESSNGHIGGWTISGGTLSAGGLVLSSNGSINSNGRFIVDTSGGMSASYANISGGVIGGCSIENGVLKIKDANISGTLSADRIDTHVIVNGKYLNLPNAMQEFASIIAWYGHLIAELQSDVKSLKNRVSSLEAKANNFTHYSGKF